MHKLLTLSLSLSLIWGNLSEAQAQLTSMPADSDVQALCGDGTYRYNLVNQNLNEVFENDEHLPLRRLVTAQSTHIPGGEQRRFLQMAPLVFESQQLEITPQAAFNQAITVTVCAHGPTGQPQVLDHFRLQAPQAESITRSYTQLSDKRLFLRIQNPAGQPTVGLHLDWKNAPLEPASEGKVWQPDTTLAPTLPKSIPGFADIHVHQASSLAFAGGWYWGSHREGPWEQRLPNCDGYNHATLNQSGLKTGIALLDPHPPQQYGKTAQWPHWKDIKHEQVSAKDLKTAHENGLGLMMASLVNNQWLAGAMVAAGLNQDGVPANDMDSVKLQLHSLWAMHKNTDWYRIVRDPWEARRVSAQGKLPVVLAIEADHLFPQGDGPWKQQLHDFYAMGVRSIQLAHQVNTHFSGAAFHRDIFKPFGRIKSLFKPEISFMTGDGYHNPVGLSPLGYELLEEMIRLNMLIDISHLSIVAQRDIYAYVAEKHKGYPLYNSHTRYGPLLTPEGAQELKEFVTTPETAVFIRRTGGMVGLRTGENPMKDFKPAQGQSQSNVLNNCDGSSRSLAQMYQAFEAHDLSIALASDFNGFISQAGPRYGEEACPNAPGAERSAQIQAQGSPPKGSALLQDFNTRGIAHMGLLPALIEDWQQLGLDTHNVDHSAETFLKMWERAYDTERKLLP